MGYVVLAHDVFLWGSRRFPLETMIEAIGDQPIAPSPFTDASAEIEHYNAVAALHEHRVAKYCTALGVPDERGARKRCVKSLGRLVAIVGYLAHWAEYRNGR